MHTVRIMHTLLYVSHGPGSVMTIGAHQKAPGSLNRIHTINASRLQLRHVLHLTLLFNFLLQPPPDPDRPTSERFSACLRALSIALNL
jgi:hypothetical protein